EWRKQKKEQQIDDPPGETGSGDSTSAGGVVNPWPELEEKEEKERRLQCLRECMNELKPEERLLMLEYYSEEKTAKIVIRERMAKRIGITSGALRQRKQRLLKELTECVLRRLNH